MRFITERAQSSAEANSNLVEAHARADFIQSKNHRWTETDRVLLLCQMQFTHPQMVKYNEIQWSPLNTHKRQPDTLKKPDTRENICRIHTQQVFWTRKQHEPSARARASIFRLLKTRYCWSSRSAASAVPAVLGSVCVLRFTSRDRLNVHSLNKRRWSGRRSQARTRVRSRMRWRERERQQSSGDAAAAIRVSLALRVARKAAYQQSHHRGSGVVLVVLLGSWCVCKYML